MIWRSSVAFAAVAPVAAEAFAKAGAGPLQWDWLGYHFGAAGMIAAVFGCVIARLWHAGAQSARKEFRWLLDVPIGLMTLGAAVVLVMTTSPEPWAGLLYGTGLGVVGEGLFKIAERMMRASGMLGEDDKAG